ncbi:hypothetical protein KSF_040410 [Reticulibacter mediterranei]|uniref:Uncharacterized protein n=1 Tax=Reticulibacter mediterranei TaxID=2778369 RepID=A0A8J3II00_9CHLR|nr:hypothetical protein [Reticulibacter mediterranei]GHO93993.1 hypothetical protein KSF_040410 [Reticulibacter mediterranei]
MPKRDREGMTPPQDAKKSKPDTLNLFNPEQQHEERGDQGSSSPGSRELSPSDEIKQIFGGQKDIPRSLGGRKPEDLEGRTFTSEGTFSTGTGFDTPGIEAMALANGLNRKIMRDRLKKLVDDTGSSQADIARKAIESNKSIQQVYDEMKKFYDDTGMPYNQAHALSIQEGIPVSEIYPRYKKVKDDTGYSKVYINEKALESNKSIEQVYNEMAIFYQNTGMTYDQALALSAQEGIPESEMYSRYKKVKDDTGYSHKFIIDQTRPFNLGGDTTGAYGYKQFFNFAKAIKDDTNHFRWEIEAMARTENKPYAEVYQRLKERNE